MLSLAEKLNYHPNPYARSLRKRNSNTVAIIIPEIENNFFALVINGIEEIAQQNGYHVLIYITHENIRKEIEFVSHLLSGRVDGVIMSLSGEPTDVDHISKLIENNVPVVGEEDAANFVLVLEKKADVGNDDVNAEQLVIGKHHAGVDNDDGARAAERHPAKVGSKETRCTTG